MQNCNSKYKTDLAERCVVLSLSIIKALRHLPRRSTEIIIRDQVIRSATSIGANIVEARASTSRTEFKRFLEISLRSANETKYWLYLSKKAGSLEAIAADRFLKETGEIASMLGASVIKLRKK